MSYKPLLDVTEESTIVDESSTSTMHESTKVDYENATETNKFNESVRLRQKYPRHVPVVLLVAGKDQFRLRKTKYLVPYDMTMAKFRECFKKHIDPPLTEKESVFIFIKNEVPSPTKMIQELDKEFKFTDGFLYITISPENTFGSN